MRKIILHFVLWMVMGMFAAPADAKPHQLTWNWPTTDCDNGVILGPDLMESELIFDTVPMPMPSDADNGCGANDPGPPTGATVVPIPVTTTIVTLNLQPGQTYFARIRVSAYVNGNWSSWSTQTQFTVPYGRPNKFILSDGWLRYEYEEIGVTKLKIS